MHEKQIALFLFAHQDDEFGVYHQILIERRRGSCIMCAYLTSGMPFGMSCTRRNQESMSVLGKLGVPPENIVFAGELLHIADGTLADSMKTASTWMASFLTSLSSIDSVFVPAWEGGHPDHDSLHAITVQLCSELPVNRPLVRQFPLYNASRCPKPFYRVLAPLRENGAVVSSRIPWRHRVRFLGFALSYHSQMKSWVGLFPFLLAHYILRGTQDLQVAHINRIHQRPHNGTLYYEQRHFSTWASFKNKLSSWLSFRSAEDNLNM